MRNTSTLSEWLWVPAQWGLCYSFFITTTWGLIGPWSFQLGLVEKDDYIMHIMYVCIYNIYMSVCVWSCTNFNNNSFWSALLMWFYIQIHQMDFESFSLYRAVYKGWRIFLAGWDWNICSKILPQKVNKICLPCVYKVRAVYIFMAV